MSDDGGRRDAERAAAGDDPFDGLEAAVREALDRLSELHLRAEAAEARAAEFEELLRRFTNDEGEATRLLSRLETLEADNRELRHRLTRGREGVDRLLARVRFLEDQR